MTRDPYDDETPGPEPAGCGTLLARITVFLALLAITVWLLWPSK